MMVDLRLQVQPDGIEEPDPWVEGAWSQEHHALLDAELTYRIACERQRPMRNVVRDFQNIIDELKQIQSYVRRRESEQVQG